MFVFCLQAIYRRLSMCAPESWLRGRISQPWSATLLGRSEASLIVVLDRQLLKRDVDVCQECSIHARERKEGTCKRLEKVSAVRYMQDIPGGAPVLPTAIWGSSMNSHRVSG